MGMLFYHLMEYSHLRINKQFERAWTAKIIFWNNTNSAYTRACEIE